MLLGMTWRLMNTHPLEDRILVLKQNGSIAIAAYERDHEGVWSWFSDGGRHISLPKRWMPLPAIPMATEAKKKTPWQGNTKGES